jgi:hypothetical protein
MVENEYMSEISLYLPPNIFLTSSIGFDLKMIHSVEMIGDATRIPII